MNSKEFHNETMYQVMMNIARTMLENRLICKREYNEIDTIMDKKYNPILGKLFSDITLT